MVVCKGGFGVAEDAAEGDLAVWGFNHWITVALGAFGGFDFEFGALEEETMPLEEGAVGVAPRTAANVVNVSRVAGGEDEDGGLVVAELFDIARKNID